MDDTTPDLAAEIAELRTELARVRALVDPAPAPSVQGSSGGPTPASDQPIGRRAALKRAGMVAAGAVAGGVAIVGTNASPAAAATVTGSGNPGVVGTGTGGDGVRGTTDTAQASGVYAATATTGAYGLFARHSGDGRAIAAVGGATGTTEVVRVTSQSKALAMRVQGAGVAAEFYGGTDGYSTMGVTAATTDNVAMQVYNQSGGGISYEGRSGDGGTAYRARLCTTGLDVSVAGFGARLVSDAIQLQIRPFELTVAPPPGRPGYHEPGSLTSDGTDLWYCVQGGTPGTWRKLSGKAAAGAFHVLPAPARIYDSRPGTSPAVGTKSPLAANAARTLDLKVNSSGVPAGATAALLTVLVVNAPAGAGNLTVWANGVARPAANTMVWGPSGGRFTATAVSALDDQARIQVSANLATDVVLDVVGYYR